MSSSTFEVSLQPDPVLQRRVAAAGLLALAIGTVLIGCLPLAVGVRLAGAAGWVSYSALELWVWCRGVRSLATLRFAADGQLHGLFQNGLWQLLDVLPGSRVASRYVWLRLGNDTCRVSGILLTAERTGKEDWRRLQTQLRFGR